MQQPADMVHVVRQSERLCDHLSHAAAGPQIGKISGGQRATQQDLDEFVLLRVAQLAAGTGMRLCRQPNWAVRFKARFQRRTLEIDARTLANDGRLIRPSDKKFDPPRGRC